MAHERPYRLLVVADDSPVGHRAGRHAARLAAALRAPAVTLLYVQPAIPGPVLTPGAPGPDAESRLSEAVHAAERAVLEAFARLFAEAGIEPECRIEVGAPAEAILRVASAGDYDLLVIGSETHSELLDLLKGGVTQTVLHHAPCPVLVVR